MTTIDMKEIAGAFRTYYGDNLSNLVSATESFRTLLALLVSNRPFPTPVVTARLKDREGCIGKFERKYLSLLEGDPDRTTIPRIEDHITDLIGVRAVCLYQADVVLVKNIILENFEVVDITDKTAKIESQDNTFGYKGLHLDLRMKPERAALPEYRSVRDFRFELQLRTIIQDAWSSLDHKIKYKKSIPASLKRRINVLAALFELADQEFMNIRDATALLEAGAPQQLVPVPQNSAKESRLDAFQFLDVVRDYFPEYQFVAHRVDGFVDDLLQLHPGLTALELSDAIRENQDILKEYEEYQRIEFGNKMNPFTILRHALYLHDDGVFGPVLFENSRINLRAWLNSRRSRENDITGKIDGAISVGADGSHSLKNISCPECDSPVRAPFGGWGTAERFCLACNARLLIEKTTGKVVESTKTVPLVARAIAPRTLECPSCKTPAQTFYGDSAARIAVCYTCSPHVLLRCDDAASISYSSFFTPTGRG